MTEYYRASVEKLRIDAAKAARIRDLTNDPMKRDFFGQMHDHLTRLADEVELAKSTERVRVVREAEPARRDRWITKAVRWVRRSIKAAMESHRKPKIPTT